MERLEHERICIGGATRECSRSVIKKIGKVKFEDIEDCMSKTFSKSGKKSESANSALESEYSYWKSYGSYFYPSVVINNITYRVSHL
jgi:hypothetical protein